jgi:RNA polymerase sigma-70 factor (ECF subfamily)
MELSPPTRQVSLTVQSPGWQRQRIPTTLKSSGKGGGAGGRDIDPALRDAVLAYDPLLYGLAMRLCGNAADARDLVQDVLESALRSGERLASVENLRSWLVTILHRRSIDLFRRQNHELLTEQVDEAAWVQPQPSDVPEWSKVTHEQLVAAVEQLEEEYRTVFRMHAFEGRSYKQIVEAMKIPMNTVGTRLYRARGKLKEILFGGRGEVEQ